MQNAPNSHTSEEHSEEFDYKNELKKLETQLCIWQYWIQKKGLRVVIIVEGRVAAGKTATINCIVRPLPSHNVRVVSLPDSSTREKDQWYFQRYISHLPAAGEIVIFDRSWYSRVLADPFLQEFQNDGEINSDTQIEKFLKSAALLERILVNDGIILRKYWLSLSRSEQGRRLEARAHNRLLSWRLSASDQKAFQEFDKVTAAKEQMIKHTDKNDLVDLRWRHIDAVDEKRARLNTIHDILSNMHYEDVVPDPEPLPEIQVEAIEVENKTRNTGLYYVLDHYGIGSDE